MACADGEGVALEPYRALLKQAFEADGGVSLLRAGEALRAQSHPFLFVLLNSDSPLGLIEKEARLAAFIHSRHRVVVREHGAAGVTLEHQSIFESRPEPWESLAACGQHLVLLEEIGCRGLRLRLPATAEPGQWVYEGGAMHAPAPGDFGTWRFEWDAYQPTRKPMPGLDEVLMGGAGAQDLSEAPTAAASVAAVLRRDLGRSWRIAEVAGAIGTSPRSLQRALAETGDSYSDVVDRTRNQEAARLLERTSLSVTEIGYVCGFADTAHFSRSFKKRWRRTPSEHRARR